MIFPSVSCGKVQVTVSSSKFELWFRKNKVVCVHFKSRFVSQNLITEELVKGSVHPVTYKAHESAVACLTINSQGTLAASASQTVMSLSIC